MRCQDCGGDNREDARFCLSCGASLALRCECGRELPAGSRFCDGCGRRIGELEPARVAESRKTVTILFADLAGSTGLQERMDPESVRRVMDRYYDAMREQVEAHGGRVVKFIGDGVMAAFGVPQVAEDDALRALRAAWAMQDAFTRLARELAPELSLRIGVNTGEVIVSESHDDVVGDAVNVASRLEHAAPSGRVLVGEDTSRLVRGQVSLKAIEPLVLRGRTEPVPAFVLVSLEPEDSAPPSSSFVGREREIARLSEVFDEALAAGRARLVTVIGSPGLGKTRLALEFGDRLAGRARVIEARCERSGSSTFAPIAEALRETARIADDATPAQVVEALAALLPSGDPDRDKVAERTSALLGAAGAATPEETFWAVRRTLEALARRRPVVLLLDDVHWAEPMLLDLVQHLTEWTREAPLLVLALARPELRESRPGFTESGGRVAAVISLDGLEPGASARLARDLLGADVPPDVARRVLDSSEGNPLFLGELVRSLVEDGVLVKTGGSWVSTVPADRIEVPPTIQALLASRIERLRPDERSVVERASVIGKHFYRGAVAELSPAPVRAGLDGHLETLRRRELASPDGTYWIDEPVFRFHHVLIRDAAYRRLLKEARAELHERFAEWLERKVGSLIGEHEEVIGYHLEQAHEYRRQLGTLDDHTRELGLRASSLLASAGRRALDRDDAAAAGSLLGRAIAGLEDGHPDRAGLLVDRCEALLSAGDATAAADVVATLVRAAEEAPDFQAWADCYTAQLANLTDPARLNEMAQIVESAAARFAAAGDRTGEAKAHAVHAQTLARLGRVGASEAALDRALAAAREAGDRRRANAVLAGAPLAALWGPSPVSRASGRCLDVVRILRITSGAPAVEATAMRCQAVLEALRGRADAGRRMIQSARATLIELGDKGGLLETDMLAGVIELLDGQAAGAEDHLRGAHRGFRELGDDVDAAQAAALLARACLLQGRAGEALELTRESESLGGDDLKSGIAWRAVRAEALAAGGDGEEALRLAQAAVAIAEPTDALVDHADARLALAAVLRASGRTGEAESESRRAAELYERKGATAPAARAGAGAPTGAAEPSLSAVPANAPADRYVAAFNARDWEAVTAMFREDFKFVDRRPVGFAERDRSAFVAGLRAFVELAPDTRLRIVGRLHSTARVDVSQFRNEGHMADGGGESVLELIAGMAFDDNGLIRSGIAVDPEAADEALAWARGFESPESALAKVGAACNARDWDELEGLVTPDFLWEDRRPGGFGVLDMQAWLQTMRALLSGDERIEAPADLKTPSDRVEIGTWRMSGHLPDGGGDYLFDLIAVCELASPGRIRRLYVFDTAARREAMAFAADVAAGENGSHTVRVVSAFNDRDWNRLSALASSEGSANAIDHRGIGFPPLTDRGEWVRRFQTMTELAPDVHCELIDFRVPAPGVEVMQVRFVGHLIDGGEFLLEFVVCNEFDADGRPLQGHLFNTIEEAMAWRTATGQRETGSGESSSFAARVRAAFNERDWDRMHAIASADFATTDHRGIGFPAGAGRHDWVQRFKNTVELAPDARTEVRGHRALGPGVDVQQVRFTGNVADGGEFLLELVVLNEVDPDGVGLGTHMFNTIEDAIAWQAQRKRDEAMPASGFTARVLSAFNDRDWERLRELASPDFVGPIDHRSIGVPPGTSRDDWVARIRAIAELAPDARCEFVGERPLLAPDVDVQHIRFIGDLVDGGEFLIELVVRNEVNPDGLAIRGHSFASVEEAEAWGVHSRSMAERYRAAWSARDVDRIADLLADDFVVVDYKIGGWKFDKAQWLERVGNLMALAPDSKMTVRDFVELDSGIEVFLASFVGHMAEGGGEYLLEMDSAWVVDGDRVRRLALFQPNDRAAAMAWAQEQSSAALIERWAAAWNARDWDAMLAVTAEEFQQIDHRLGFEPIDRASWLGSMKTICELAPDAQASVVRMVRLDGAELGQLRFDGHLEAGGEFVAEVLNVNQIGPTGRSVRGELFEVEEWSRALDRAHELAGGRGASVMERWVATWNARDWDAMRDMAIPEYEHIDHRLGFGPMSRDEWVERLEATADLAPDAVVKLVRLERWPNVEAGHWRFEGHLADGGGEFVLEFVGLTELDSSGLMRRTELFDIGEWDGLLATIGAHSAAPTAVDGAVRVWVAAYNRRDWGAYETLLTADFRATDHRPLGWGGGLDRAALIELFRVGAEMAPDAVMGVRRWLRSSGDSALLELFWHGRTSDGADFELDRYHLLRVRDGRISSFDAFELSDLAAALARFDAPADLVARVWDRWRDAVHRGDVEASADVYAEGNVHVYHDHRFTADQKAALANDRLIVSDASARVEWEPILLLGRRHGLVRFEITRKGSAPSGGAWSEAGDIVNEWLAVTRCDEDGRAVRDEIYASQDVYRALVRLEEMFAEDEAAGEDLAGSRRRSVVWRIAVAFEDRDWDAYPALMAQDMVAEDHRPAGWGTLAGREANIAYTRTVDDVTSGARTSNGIVHAVSNSAVVHTLVMSGQNAEGGRFDSHMVRVEQVGDNGIERVDVYSEDQLDLAMARFQELH